MPRSFCNTTRRSIPGTTLLILLLAGCGPTPSSSEADARPGNALATSKPTAEDTGSVLRLASTTSTRDSGLLDVLLPVFEKANACRVDLIAVGTGAALKLGETGDADAVLVHARAAEDAFMNAGHGIRHEPIMHNHFIIAGPADDPARAKCADAAAAMKSIAAGKHRFISRGDNSGTHQREQAVWKQLGGRPNWSDFIESGQGMGPTLVMADELNAYVLTDEGTWLKQSRDFRLVAIVTGASDLQNPYAAMVVNPDRHPAVNAELANRFVDFLISEKVQHLIAEYKVSGKQLFQPDRLPRNAPSDS